MRALATTVLLVALVLSACGDDSSPDAATAPSHDVTASTAPATASPTPATSASGASTATSIPGVQPQGFGTQAARAVAADGTVCELCLWIADNDEQRPRGLMGITDLGGRDGMAFVYTEPHTTSFTMRNTIMPLSIAFFGPDGSQIGDFDMEPCDGEPCPSYPTPEGFTVAVEVPQGALDELSMGPGSRLELLGTDCPLTD